MSLKQYIENKKNIQPQINMEDYQQKLYADISSLLFKPNNKIYEVKKYLIDTIQLEYLLNEVHYPYKEQLFIALKSRDVSKINRAKSMFSKLTEDSQDKSLIENLIYDYVGGLSFANLESEHVDKIISSIINEQQAFLEKIVSLLQKQNLNFEVVVEPEYIPFEYDKFSAKIKIADAEISVYKDEYTLLRESNIPSINQKIQSFLQALSKNPKYSKIMTLFAAMPMSERQYFNDLKKNMCLGYKCCIPNNVYLSESIPNTELDIYKIKINENYLVLKDGYYKPLDDSPIYWIERLS